MKLFSKVENSFIEFFFEHWRTDSDHPECHELYHSSPNYLIGAVLGLGNFQIRSEEFTLRDLHGVMLLFSPPWTIWIKLKCIVNKLRLILIPPVNTNVEDSQNGDRSEIKEYQVQPVDVDLSTVNGWYPDLWLLSTHLYVDFVLPELRGLHLRDVPAQGRGEVADPGHLPESGQVVTWLYKCQHLSLLLSGPVLGTSYWSSSGEYHCTQMETCHKTSCY